MRYGTNAWWHSADPPVDAAAQAYLVRGAKIDEYEVASYRDMPRISYVSKLGVRIIYYRCAIYSNSEGGIEDGNSDPYIPAISEAVPQGRHNNVSLKVDSCALKVPDHRSKIQKLISLRLGKSWRVGGLL